ncbi:RNA polymerase sigma factor (sigma-70 family) [Catalinimonas alkaloidigena]|uniref:RNA polymerase sigma factor n=1 Tax=Catalinimonas alkaloidigena TaxID=1075417 RepID=UPI0024058D8A|nr:sigma-70 family RNA polymerase sigma factor [Catalinimonas alkaloidigena]MDF9799609.1 RNA polymerase sigma factor (sigma-70 family) [Catalinimonas alkaloidigena]
MNEKRLHFSQYEDQPKENCSPVQYERAAQKVSKSDAEIWRDFRRGDEEALVFIYTEYVNKMYNYGCQFTAQKELVSDCIQELFTEIISKRHKLGSTDSIKHYLFKALRRKLVRELKKEKKYQHQHETSTYQGFNILEDTSVKFINQEFTNHQKSIISSECNQLPVRQKEALLLYFYEGMSYKEIADTIGMSRTKSARALIYRAVDSMTRRLQKYKDILYPLWPLLVAAQLL